MSVRLLCMLVFGLLAVGSNAAPRPISGLEFVIAHNNDMHSRFEQTGKYSNACTEEEARANKCYGGFARVSTVLKKLRTDAQNGGPSVLYLNAGDTYTGTPWFTLFKDKITADFLNILKPDAAVSTIYLSNYSLPGEQRFHVDTNRNANAMFAICIL